MKDKVRKRKNVDWFKLLKSLENPSIDAEFLSYLFEHKRWNPKKRVFDLPSYNRAAYNVLRRHYSTTAILRYRITGELLDDVCRSNV